jgi:predicted membrane channel-forming protein YqfA (hemolysin III family)
MSAQTPVASELLVLPEWFAVALYFVVIPLGLLVGYFAFRGFRRTDRTSAEFLALGIILLTVVDTILGTSVSIASLVELSRATPLLRAVVQLLGVAAIIYAMYRPERAVGGQGGTPPAEPLTRSDTLPRGEEDRNGPPTGRDGESK